MNTLNTRYAVVVVGAGPTGLMLAAELALAGVDVAVVERRATPELVGSRAGGLHSRTLEVLDQRGVVERFVSQGQKYPVVHFHPVSLPIDDFPTRHNYTLGLWQTHIERLLREWVAELGVPIHRGREVVDLEQDDEGVDALLADGERLRADYLVGCDGGRSAVRKSAGIDFPGSDATTSWLIAEVQMGDEPKWGFRHDAAGIHGIGKADRGRVRVVLTEARLETSSEPTVETLRAALVGVYGTDFKVHSPAWISRFDDMTRQAATYRERRVLLAGDSAHVHPPVGGQGLNVGVQDAVNLGWKLAQVVEGVSPPALLDTYHAERHPVAARVLHNTMAQVALRRTDARSEALGDIVSQLLRMQEPRVYVAGMLSGLDVRYDFGEGHALLGRRMPDLDLRTPSGSTRVFTLLRDASTVLLNFGERGAFEGRAWQTRVRSLDVQYDGAWDLPVVGRIAAPNAVLIRPDGYVAWVGAGESEGLNEALTARCGAQAPM